MKLGDGKLIRADGPTIQYLEIRQRSDGTPRWYQNNHWVRSDRQMALTYRAIQLIETLWEVARLRYAPEPRPNRFQVRLFGGASWWDIFTSDVEDTGGIVIEDMAMELRYYEAAPSAADDAAAEAAETAADPVAVSGPDRGAPDEG